MSVKHTPHWRLKANPTGGSPDDDYFEILAGVGYHIRGDAPGFCVSGFIAPHDARLIAAAPDLLTALKDLDERLRKCFNAPITAQEAYDSFHQHIVAKALAEAEGA